MKRIIKQEIFFALFLSLLLTISMMAVSTASGVLTAHAAEENSTTTPDTAMPGDVTPDTVIPDDGTPDKPLSPPTIDLSIVEDGIQVTWNQVPDAEGYYVMRKTGDGEWKKLANISGDSVQNPSGPSSVPSDSFTYTDHKVKEGKAYHYAVKSHKDAGKSVSAYSNKLKIKYILPPQLRLSVTSAGVSLSWAPQTGASGYYVYRKTREDADWTLVKKLTSGSTVAWKDMPTSNGTHYGYIISSYSGGYESIPSAETSVLWLKSPTVKLSRSSNTMTVKWSKHTSADGYELQYASDGFFLGEHAQSFNDNAIVSAKISGLSNQTTYFARVRAYKVSNGKTYYSDWGLSSNAKSRRTLKASALYAKAKVTTKGKNGKKKKKTVNKIFELRSKAKLSMYGYDTVQGSCTDGKYGYFAMNNRKKEKCRIVKVNLSKPKVVKVSPVLNIGHGNGMAFVKHRNAIAVVHKSASKNRVTFVNRDSLRVSHHKNVKIPEDLPGATKSQRKKIASFSAIAYDPESKNYAAVIKGTTNFLILNKDLDPIRYITPSFKNSYLNQGLDATEDYIILSQSPKSKSQKYNIFSVYTWDGIYVRTINVKKGYELESAFHSGSKFHAGVYRSYNQPYYKTVKKTVTVKGKKKKKTVKVRRWRLMRDNYLYRLSGF